MPLEYSIMRHFELTEFSGAKPKYLESYLMQFLRKVSVAGAGYLDSHAAIASRQAPAVNGTKA